MTEFIKEHDKPTAALLKDGQKSLKELKSALSCLRGRHLLFYSSSDIDFGLLNLLRLA